MALFDLHVIGVAIATVLSALISLILAFIRLFGKRTGPNLKWRDIRLGRLELIEIVRVGIPTCISALFFYAANVVLSSAVNSISTEAMTANAISGQFDGIIYTVGAAIAAASSVMVAQNYGAKKINRIKKIIPIGIVYSTAVSLTLGSLFVITAEPLLGLLSDSRSVIEIAKDRMTLLCLTYFVTSIMEIFAFSLRALKRQKSTVIAGGICGFGIRCLWRFFVWPKKPTLSALFACFPVSAAAAIIIYLFVYRDALKDLNEDISLKI